MPLDEKMAVSVTRLDVSRCGVRRDNRGGKGEVKGRLHLHVEQKSSPHKGSGDRREVEINA